MSYKSYEHAEEAQGIALGFCSVFANGLGRVLPQVPKPNYQDPKPMKALCMQPRNPINPTSPKPKETLNHKWLEAQGSD